jgi:hypothetical protein
MYLIGNGVLVFEEYFAPLAKGFLWIVLDQ